MGKRSFSSRGKRFDGIISQRASELLEYYEAKNDPEQAADDQEKERCLANLEKIQYYRTVQNPLKSYNKNKPKTDPVKEKNLTVEALEDYLNVIEWSNKDFLEFCQEPNLQFSVQEVYQQNKPDGWQYMDWPDERMKAVAGILDSLDDESFKKAEQLINSFLPKRYSQLMKEMERESREIENNRGKPIYAENDNFIPEKAIENMGERLTETIRYIETDINRLKDRLEKIGINYEPIRQYTVRHYWLFPVQKLNLLCREFNISPHWAFFGSKDQILLAKKQRTEYLLDKFSFLPENAKQNVSDSIKYAYDEGGLK